MEHRTDSSTTPSHGCLVILVLFGALLAAFACSPAPYRPIVAKPSAPPPTISDAQWAREVLRVPPGSLSQGRMRGVPHFGPMPKPSPGDRYVGDYTIQIFHYLDHCDLLVGTDPWCFRYFKTVKDAKARGYRPCTYCIYPDYR
jgi:hypothetical protein